MITFHEIRTMYRPFRSVEEANRVIKNRMIMKRPGVFNDDRKEKYTIVHTDNCELIFEDWRGERTYYFYDNIIYDYLFTDGEVIGIKR